MKKHSYFHSFHASKINLIGEKLEVENKWATEWKLLITISRKVRIANAMLRYTMPLLLYGAKKMYNTFESPFLFVFHYFLKINSIFFWIFTEFLLRKFFCVVFIPVVTVSFLVLCNIILFLRKYYLRAWRF